MLILCDIDGCLADVRAFVKKYLQDGKSDWDGYFAHQPEFPIVGPVVALVHDYACLNSGNVDNLGFMTGRPERTRADTEKWLREHVTSNFSVLLMRPEDYRGSTLVLKCEQKGWDFQKLMHLGEEAYMERMDDIKKYGKKETRN